MYLALAEAPGEMSGIEDFHAALAAYGLPAAGGRLSVRPSIKKRRGGLYVLKITGEQIREPVSCSYYPDTESPVTAIFDAASSSLDIELPVSSRFDDRYVDISFLKRQINEINKKGPDAGKATQAFEKIISDSDCINAYLILNTRTISMLSRLLAELTLFR